MTPFQFAMAVNANSGRIQGLNLDQDVKTAMSWGTVTAIGVNEDGSPFEFGIERIGVDEETSSLVIILGPKL